MNIDNEWNGRIMNLIILIINEMGELMNIWMLIMNEMGELMNI